MKLDELGENFGLTLVATSAWALNETGEQGKKAQSRAVAPLAGAWPGATPRIKGIKLSDIFSTLLGGMSSIPEKVIKTHKSYANPCILDNSSSSNPLIFILDSYPTKEELTLLKALLKSQRISDFKILYCLEIDLTVADLNKTIWRQYVRYSWDFTKYIAPKSKVIAFGRSLYSLTKCNDLDCSIASQEDSSADDKKLELSIVNGFYDTLLWKTHFYLPNIDCEIFPVDNKESFFKAIDGTNIKIKNSFEVWFLKKQMHLAWEYIVPCKKIIPIKKVFVKNPNEFLAENKNKSKKIGIDLETGSRTNDAKISFDPWSKDSFIRCITLSFYDDPYTGYYLRYEAIDVSILSSFLEGKDCIGTNIKFDFRFLNVKAHIPLKNLHIYADTMQLQQICNETFRKGLKSGAYMHTLYGGYDAELDSYLEDHPDLHGNYGKIPENILMPYATTDPCVSLLLYKELTRYRDALDEKYNRGNKYGYNLKWIYEEIMMPCLNVYLEMELNGIKINTTQLEKLSKSYKEKVDSLEKEILLELGETKESFKLTSTDMLGLKFKSLGWNIRGVTKKGIPRTDERELEEWYKEDKHTVCKKILEFREISKLYTTYIGNKDEKTGMWKFLKEDGRLHSMFAPFLASSLRNKSSNPNFQNFPAHGPLASDIKSFMQPFREHTTFISTDYSGLQLHIVGFQSFDQILCDIFKKPKGDVHLMTAQNVFLKYIMGIPSFEEAKKLRKGGDEATASQINNYRSKSKTVNFSLLFGATATSLYRTLKDSWMIEDCNAYIKQNSLSEQEKTVSQNIKKKKYQAIPYTKRFEEDSFNAKLLTCAIDIRTKFFDTYAGLLPWIEGNRAFAKKNGYIGSVYGSIRRLPYLTFFGDRDSVDVDWQKYSNYLNIAVNSPTQTCENMIIGRSIRDIDAQAKANSLDLSFFANIHDANELISGDSPSTIRDNAMLIHKIAETSYPEYEGLLMEVESCISNTWDIGKKYATEDLATFKDI